MPRLPPDLGIQAACCLTGWPLSTGLAVTRFPMAVPSLFRPEMVRAAALPAPRHHDVRSPPWQLCEQTCCYTHAADLPGPCAVLSARILAWAPPGLHCFSAAGSHHSLAVQVTYPLSPSPTACHCTPSCQCFSPPSILYSPPKWTSPKANPVYSLPGLGGCVEEILP